jgi:hypothetical protein
VAVLLSLCLLATASVAGIGLSTGWRFEPAVGGFTAAPVYVNGGTVPSPGPDAEESDVLAFIEEQIALALDAQSAALLDGDLDGWLNAYEPTLHDTMARRFNGLNAMAVSRFDQRLVNGPHAKRRSAIALYDARIELGYCLASPADDCSPMSFRFDATWRLDGESMRMVEVEDSSVIGDGPHPWEVDELSAVVGARTVVAAPKSLEDRLDGVLRKAEDAAATADAWARWGKPDKYLVYLATEEEFTEWFGNSWPGEHTHGYAMPMTAFKENGIATPSGYVTVIAANRTGWEDGLASILRHELGHIATLWNAKKRQATDSSWWMVEGIAEYIDHGSAPVSRYDRMWDVERHRRDGGCKEEFGAPEYDGDLTTISGMYGCAFLGVHYMITTYGEDAFAEWFEASVREGGHPASTATAIFGKDYERLTKEMLDFIARTA